MKYLKMYTVVTMEKKPNRKQLAAIPFVAGTSAASFPDSLAPTMEPTDCFDFPGGSVGHPL